MHIKMQAYLKLNKKEPVICNLSVTFIVTYSSSVIAQKLFADKVDYMVAYIYAIVSTIIIFTYIFFVRFISKYSLIQQIFADTLIYSIIGTYIFIHLHSALSDLCCKEKYCYKKCNDTWPIIVKASLSVWPLVNFIRIKYFSPDYRIMIGIFVSFFYNIYVAKLLVSRK